MNTLVLQNEFLLPRVGAGIRLLGLPAEKSAKKQLSGSVDEVVKTIASLLDQITASAVEQRTEESFRAIRDAAFPQYMQLVISLAGIVSAVVPKDVLARLTAESFSELEADIRDHAVAVVGAEMRDRAMFTVWTLRKIADLIPVIASNHVSKEDDSKDNEIATAFLGHALMARFNIDVLRYAMRHGKALYPVVLPAIDSGLRAVVDAYAWIRQAADLRSPSIEPEIGPVSWDEEDQELLNESMLDLASEPL